MRDRDLDIFIQLIYIDFDRGSGCAVPYRHGCMHDAGTGEYDDVKTGPELYYRL